MDSLLTTNLQVYKDTENFISLYKQPTLKQYIDGLIDQGIKVTFKGRPLLFYAKIIALSAQKKALDTRARAEYPKLYQNATRSPLELKNLFTWCTQTEQQVVGFLRLAAQDQIGTVLSRPDLATIQTADKTGPGPQKEQHYLGWINATTQQPAVVKPSATKLKLPTLKVPSAVKDLGVNVLILVKKFISRYPTQMVGGTMGAVIGALTLGPVGAVAGAVGGALGGRMVGQMLEGGGARSIPTNIPQQTQPPQPHRIPSNIVGNLINKVGKLGIRAYPIGMVVVGIFIFLGVTALFILLFDDEGGGMLLKPGEASSGTPPGSVVPGSDLDKKCDFTKFNIFQSSAVNNNLLQKYIDRALATGKIKPGDQMNRLADRARFIRDAAQGSGLNPAIFLGYWESESAFSDYSHPGVRPGMDLGCDPLNKSITSFEEDVLCAVGKGSVSNSKTSQCATSKNKNSAACQAISFQESEGVVLPISTLNDFLNSYGSKVSDPNNIQSDAVVKQTIADLGLVSCTAAPTQAICPISGGTVTCGSIGTGGIAGCENGHCGTNYDNPSNICGLVPSTAYAMDIGGSIGQTVLMPTITDPQTGSILSLSCNFVGSQTGLEGDQIKRFSCQNNIWVDFHHLQNNPTPQMVASGEPVGTIANSAGGPHVHIQLGIGGECESDSTSCVPADSYIKCK